MEIKNNTNLMFLITQGYHKFNLNKNRRNYYKMMWKFNYIKRGKNKKNNRDNRG